MTDILASIDALVIEMLEEDTRLDELTRVTRSAAPDIDGLVVSWTVGCQEARNVVRPMIQLLGAGPSRSVTSVYTPCWACYDFSRSWNCPDHPERTWKLSFGLHGDGRWE